MASDGVEVEILDFWTCLFLDPPTAAVPYTVPNEDHPGHGPSSSSGEDSLVLSNATSNSTSTSTSNSNLSPFIFYECRAYGKYLAGISEESLFNGHYICVYILILICMVGVFGIVSNVICVLVLPHSHQGSSLKDLLVILAVLELLLCSSNMAFSYLIVCILENLNRSEVVFLLFRVANIVYSLSRTGSIYITILATIERYLVVSFPVKSKSWLTALKSRVYIGLVLLLTVGLNTPLIFNSAVSTVEENDVFPPYTHVEDFPYIFKDTHFTNRDVHDFLVLMNYVAPFPFLLVFNALLYKAIYNWDKTRVRLCGSHRHEIRVAKMFSITVLVLSLCHAVSCLVFYTFRYQKLIYRELILVQLFCFIVGASVNFCVYYSLGRNFRKEFDSIAVDAKYKCFVCVEKD